MTDCWCNDPAWLRGEAIRQANLATGAMRDADAVRRTLGEARLYGEKMKRDRDPEIRKCGADLLQIIDTT